MSFECLEVNKNAPMKDVPTVKHKDVFSLGKFGSFNMFYAPLYGKVCICDDTTNLPEQNSKDYESIEELNLSKFFETPSDKFTNLGLFLSSNCNLNCVYCYARGGEDIKLMDFEYAKIAIDFMTDNIRGRLPLLFHGGGEPTLAFGILKKVVEYAKSKKDISTHLQTNGVFSNEIREWLLENINTISVSCDGPPNIQDVQRPLKNGGRSSPIVERNIQYFIENSKDIGTISVISKFSVGKQAEIVDYLHGLGVKRIRFTPLQEEGRCLSCRTKFSAQPDSGVFSNNFFKARELADLYGVKLEDPLPLDSLTNKHCSFSQSCFITPDGFVSPCLAVTSRDSDFKEVLFGRVDKKNKKVVIDKKKSDFLATRTVQNIPACQDCFMKWHCAGGCPTYSCLSKGRNLFSPDEKYCDWTRKIGIDLLSYQLQKNLIKIKPFLENRSGRIFYTGISNEFELSTSLKGEPQAALLNIDASKLNPSSLADEVIKEKPRLILLSFKINKKKLNPNPGKKIARFLRTLKLKGINFIITKPLPKCIFGGEYDEIVKEFRIPRNCEECLELFVMKDGLFHICGVKKAVPNAKIKNRKELYEIFRGSVSKYCRTPCNGCMYSQRRKCNGVCYPGMVL